MGDEKREIRSPISLGDLKLWRSSLQTLDVSKNDGSTGILNNVEFASIAIVEKCWEGKDPRDMLPFEIIGSFLETAVQLTILLLDCHYADLPSFYDFVGREFDAEQCHSR